VAELRDLARGLHPTILTNEGLVAALNHLARRSTTVAVTTDIDLPCHLEPQAAATAYYVAAEGLTNTVKYAHATTALIRAHYPDGVLTIEVSDDGIGGAYLDACRGLRNLTDRVEAHGGQLTIDSPPGHGTHLLGVIPCAPSSPKTMSSSASASPTC
jgi:signal transduction histidine kinase